MAVPSQLKMVRDFFGMTLAEMKAEWTTLPQKDKDEILSGLTTGTLTY